MPNEANAISPVAPVSPVPASPSLSAEPRGPEPNPPATDYRLVIEQGPVQGTFIYKTVDRTTGEIIKQFPREELVKMIDSTAYSTGTVADTRA